MVRYFFVMVSEPNRLKTVAESFLTEQCAAEAVWSDIYKGHTVTTWNNVDSNETCWTYDVATGGIVGTPKIKE